MLKAIKKIRIYEEVISQLHALIKAGKIQVGDQLPSERELAIEAGIWPLYEIEDGKIKFYGKTKKLVENRLKRKPVREYLLRQGRFAHFTDEDIDCFQKKTDQMWEEWIIPGVIPIQPEKFV